MVSTPPTLCNRRIHLLMLPRMSHLTLPLMPRLLLLPMLHLMDLPIQHPTRNFWLPLTWVAHILETATLALELQHPPTALAHHLTPLPNVFLTTPTLNSLWYVNVSEGFVSHFIFLRITLRAAL